MAEIEFSGKHYIVTGGTQGLGRDIALYLAEKNAEGLIICGRNENNGKEAEAEIREKGSECTFVRTDLQYEKDCRNVVAQCEALYGKADGLVNAAGLTNRGDLENTTVELWDFLFAINVRAPFVLTQDTVKLMKKNGIEGSIVNIISDTAHGGYTFLTPYSSAKGALATFTKNAANTLLKDRIRVNGVLIGWMYTPHEHQIQLESGQSEDWLKEAEQAQPFGRLLRPRDVSYLAAYLLSEQAKMMTGSLIDFDQKVIGTFD